MKRKTYECTNHASNGMLKIKKQCTTCKTWYLYCTQCQKWTDGVRIALLQKCCEESLGRVKTAKTTEEQRKAVFT